MAERPLSPKKRLGAYYTAPLVVDFLVGWGLGAATGICMDPSCGDGRFLAAAARRGAGALIGCDIDPHALALAEGALADLGQAATLHRSDFFLLDPQALGPVDLLIGNPPYIRFQQFSGESRARALASALRVGARLSRLAASWAPFLLHGLQFLRPGGAMAVVVPAELAQTTYGVETLRALCANFRRLRLVTFRHNWFEEAQQETFLLLAEGRGGSCTGAELIPLDRIEDLPRLDSAAEGVPVPLGAAAGARLGLAHLDPQTRGLIAEVSALGACIRLAALGDVANGYVTGANDFFHCTAAAGRARVLPSDWLLPVARNSRSLTGLSFGREDVIAAEGKGVAHHLILPRQGDLFSDYGKALEAFVQEGEKLGICRRYKCRVRNPWWQVPGLIQPDLFLPYMIGGEPHASVNLAHALYPNSLHGMRLHNPALAAHVAVGLLTSLSLLSMELTGRSYGGGVLKLEPTEMQRVQLVLPSAGESLCNERCREADIRIRAGDFDAATRLADGWILGDQLGLPSVDIERLRDARELLLQRRMTRARSGK